MQPPILYDSPEGLVRILATAPVIYFTVIAYVRLAGKRSTSQMNNFDWLVTVALGSIMGSGIMLKDVTIAETALAIGLLLGMQWLLTKLIFHAPPVARLAKARPALLVSHGDFVTDTLRRERVTEEEVLAAIRSEGLTSVDEVAWVILETDATLNVIPGGKDGKGGSPLRDTER